MKAVSLEPFEYVCACDRDLPTERQTVFILKPLRWVDKLDLLELAQSESNRDQLLVFHRVMQKSLVGWRNFDGAPAFAPGDPSMIDYVDDRIVELAKAVLERAKLSEAYQKN